MEAGDADHRLTSVGETRTSGEQERQRTHGSASMPTLDLMDAPLGLVSDAADANAQEAAEKSEASPPPAAEKPAAEEKGEGSAPPSVPVSPREVVSENGLTEGASARSSPEGTSEESETLITDDETAALLGSRASVASPVKAAPAPAREATRRETLLASAVGALGALTRGGGTGDPEKDKENAARENAERMKARRRPGARPSVPLVLHSSWLREPR